jgi:hypothetical protein
MVVALTKRTTVNHSVIQPNLLQVCSHYLPTWAGLRLRPSIAGLTLHRVLGAPKHTLRPILISAAIPERLCSRHPVVCTAQQCVHQHTLPSPSGANQQDVGPGRADRSAGRQSG